MAGSVSGQGGLNSPSVYLVEIQFVMLVGLCIMTVLSLLTFVSGTVSGCLRCADCGKKKTFGNLGSLMTFVTFCVCCVSHTNFVSFVQVWTKYDSARWCGVRDSAHEKLYKLLYDPSPEVSVLFHAWTVQQG